MSFTILLPVDGSEGSIRAAKYVLSIAKMIPDMKVHVLNVQAAGDDWMIKRSIKPEELKAMQREWGEAAIAPVREIMRSKIKNYSEHMSLGDVSQIIARKATELSCNQIVMGTRGQTALSGLFMGSITTKVLHIADIPVTLVK